jgi:hypothetical protein
MGESPPARAANTRRPTSGIIGSPSPDSNRWSLHKAQGRFKPSAELEERLRDAAAFAVRCGELCTPALMEPLAKVARSLEKYADQLLAAK